MNTASFWQKNQVLISSLIASITIILQQAIEQPVVDWKMVGLGVVMAVAGILGNEWRGKPLSVLGLIGVAGYAFVNIQSTGHFSWDKFILSFMIGAGLMAVPSPKSIGYEKTDIIKAAKKEGEIDVPTPLSPKPDNVIN